MSVSAIVLAAGEGTRMKSSRPKPLHLICGRAMVLHVIHALERVHPERTVVVVGHGAEQVTKKVQQLSPGWANVAFAEQLHQNGTGDAASIGMSALGGDDYDDESRRFSCCPATRRCCVPKRCVNSSTSTSSAATPPRCSPA